MRILALLAVTTCFLATPVKADEQLEVEIQRVLDRMEAIYRADPNGSHQIFDELWLQHENIPDALWALNSDRSVEVSVNDWIVFRPRIPRVDEALVFYPGGECDERG